MARRAVFVAIPITLAYVLHRIHNLNQQFPLLPHSDYHQTPSTLPTLPHDHDQGDYIYARVPLRRPIGSPLDTFIDAFYSTWTLRLESLLTRFAHIAPTHLNTTAQAFCNGLFPVYKRYDDSIIVQWATPPSIINPCRRLDKPTVGGGTQELSAVIVNGGTELEISYACAQWMDGPRGNKLGEVQMALHRFYMRFLLDSARKRLNGML